MLRMLIGLMMVLTLCAGNLLADDKNKDDQKKDDTDKGVQATITKLDRDKGMITLKMKDKNGKEEEKTFHLTEDIRYLDSKGKVVAIDVFKSGHEVLVFEEKGKLRKLYKHAKKELRKENKNTEDRKSGGS